MLQGDKLYFKILFKFRCLAQITTVKHPFETLIQYFFLYFTAYPIVTMPTNEDDDAYAHKIPAKLGSQFTFNISFYSNSEDVQSKFYRLFNNTRVNVLISEEISSTDVTLRVYKTAVQTKGKTLAISYTVRGEDQFGLYNVDIINRFGTARVHLQIIPEGIYFVLYIYVCLSTPITCSTVVNVLKVLHSYVCNQLLI